MAHPVWTGAWRVCARVGASFAVLLPKLCTSLLTLSPPRGKRPFSYTGELGWRGCRSAGPGNRNLENGERVIVGINSRFCPPSF